MQEHPDDEQAREGLDRLFRKSAEEFNPQYDPAAWQLLNARLDEHDRVTAWGRALRWGLAVMALVVLVIGSWYGYKQAQVNTLTVVEQGYRTPAQLQSGPATTPPAQLAQADNSRPGGVGMADASSNNKPDTSIAIEPAGPNSKMPVTTRKAELPVGPILTDKSRSRLEARQSLSTMNEYSNPMIARKKAQSVAKQPHKEIAGRHNDDQPMQLQTSQRRRLGWPVVRQPSFVSEDNAPDAPAAKNADLTRKESKQSVSYTIKTRSTSTNSPPIPNKLLVGRSTSPATMPKSVGRPEWLVSEQTNSGAAPTGNDPITPTIENAPAANSLAASSSDYYRIGPVDALSGRVTMHWPQWPMLVAPALALPEPSSTVSQSVTPVRERGLSIRLAISPDLSAIGLKNFARPGTNYGALVEYRFSKRFSAQAGFFQSNKIYKATPDQYEWPARWAAWKVKPIEVQGTCDMFDIPINLRYDVALRPLGENHPPARWFVSSGITTYVMKKESYDYSYENPEDPLIKTRSWSTKTGRYNFSNLNLSVGYERPIGRRFAWQVEPFVKMPLKAVGYFKINLLSTGAFLSLRYRL